MNISDVHLAAAFRLGIAAVIGLGVGLEREWSGHASGPQARFAGLRTFLLLGLLGGTAGLLVRENHEVIATLIALSGMVFSIAAYVMATRRDSTDLDGTTEVAAMLVIALGVLAGAFSWLIAAAAGSLVVLVLNEKKRLHGVVAHLRQDELSAALQFAVLALVILPILPTGPYLGWADVRPRSLWMIVLLFCFINFAGFIGRRNAGERHAYLLVGLLGGVVSSTAVTLGFARYSRQRPEASSALAWGVVGACTVLVPRVLLISAVLNPAVAIQLAPLLVPAGLIGFAGLSFAWRSQHPLPKSGEAPASWLSGKEKSPLSLGAAVSLAVIFQISMIAITFARQKWAVTGLYSSSVVLGLTNADALTVSMSNPSTPVVALLAAHAIAIGVLANTVVKLVLSVAIGSARYRLIAGGVLAAMGITIGVLLILI